MGEKKKLLQRNQNTSGKNVVGVDLPFDEPQFSDVVVENDGLETPETIVSRLEKEFGL